MEHSLKMKNSTDRNSTELGDSSDEAKFQFGDETINIYTATQGTVKVYLDSGLNSSNYVKNEIAGQTCNLNTALIRLCSTNYTLLLLLIYIQHSHVR